MNFFTFALKYLPQLITSPGSFPVIIAGQKFFLSPRSLDIATLKEVFFDQIYDPPWPLKKVATVMDLGANLGAFSLWAKWKWRPKKILAVEMDKANFRLLRKNVPGITSLNRAVYAKTGVNINYDRHPLFSLLNRVSDTSTRYQALSISFADLLKHVSGPIDVLKIDIEGSEKYLFTKENAPLFQKRVKYLTLESHPFFGYDPASPLRYLQSLGFEVVFQKSHAINGLHYNIQALNQQKV